MNWETMGEYTSFFIYIILVCIVLQLVEFQTNFKQITVIFGYVALIGESLMAIPQVYENYRYKSGSYYLHSHQVWFFRKITGLLWLFGDISKTTYYIFTAQSYPFLISGSLQVIVDLFILYQSFMYTRSHPTCYKIQSFCAIKSRSCSAIKYQEENV